VSAKLKVEENSYLQDWFIKGKLNTRLEKCDIKLYSAGKNSVIIPGIENLYKTKASFDTLECVFETRSANHFSAIFDIRFNKLKLFSLRLSQKEMIFDLLKVSGGLHADKIYLSSDKTSSIQINDLGTGFYFSYKPSFPKEIGVKYGFSDVPSNVFFASLPEGMFNVVRGIRAEGSVSFQTEFYINTKQPDSLTFQANFKKKNFSIRNYGNSDLLKMNSSFEYTAFEKDIPARTFILQRFQTFLPI
jgi:hypothetical protein